MTHGSQGARELLTQADWLVSQGPELGGEGASWIWRANMRSPAFYVGQRGVALLEPLEWVPPEEEGSERTLGNRNGGILSSKH